MTTCWKLQGEQFSFPGTIYDSKGDTAEKAIWDVCMCIYVELGLPNTQILCQKYLNMAVATLEKDFSVWLILRFLATLVLKGACVTQFPRYSENEFF